MHMINLHAAEDLAEDLGLDLVDIYGIRRWKAMQASPLNNPDIVREFIRILPVNEFGKHLKVNRLWYNCCMAELWKRHEEAGKAYYRAVDEYEEAIIRSLLGSGISNHEHRELEWEVLHKNCEKTNAGIEYGRVKRALNQFGFNWKYGLERVIRSKF